MNTEISLNYLRTIYDRLCFMERHAQNAAVIHDLRVRKSIIINWIGNIDYDQELLHTESEAIAKAVKYTLDFMYEQIDNQ